MPLSLEAVGALVWKRKDLLIKDMRRNVKLPLCGSPHRILCLKEERQKHTSYFCKRAMLQSALGLERSMWLSYRSNVLIGEPIQHITFMQPRATSLSSNAPHFTKN